MITVARPSVNVPTRIVRDALDAFEHNVTHALAHGLRAALECIISEWIASAALVARGLTLRPHHLLVARDTDPDLRHTLTGVIPHTGGARTDNTLAFINLK